MTNRLLLLFLCVTISLSWQQINGQPYCPANLIETLKAAGSHEPATIEQSVSTGQRTKRQTLSAIGGLAAFYFLVKHLRQPAQTPWKHGLKTLALAGALIAAVAIFLREQSTANSRKHAPTHALPEHVAYIHSLAKRLLESTAIPEDTPVPAGITELFDTVSADDWTNTKSMRPPEGNFAHNGGGWEETARMLADAYTPWQKRVQSAGGLLPAAESDASPHQENLKRLAHLLLLAKHRYDFIQKAKSAKLSMTTLWEQEVLKPTNATMVRSESV